MQVFCKKANGDAELHCCVCGQGFELLWNRQTAIERVVVRAELQELLRRQHRITAGPEAHLQEEFAITSWESSYSRPIMEPAKVRIWDL